MHTKTPDAQILARSIPAALTNTEYTLRGKRSHIFVLKSGDGEMVGANKTQRIEASTFVWLPPGEQRVFRLGPGSTGWMASIPDMHLGPFIPPGTIGNNIRSVVNQLTVVSNISSKDFQRIAGFISNIQEEISEDLLASNTAVHYCISLLLIQFWRLRSHKTEKGKPLPRNLVHNFIFLIDRHYKDHWKVAQYAEQIGVSDDRLTTAVRRATGETPLELIHKKLMSEAKALLTNSSMQIAEIAYQLGFRDAAYFNRFFSRQSGLSPGRYGAKQRAAFAKEKSFAAWP